MTTARVDRRLAAILAADVVGYSRLMGADEEGTLARLKACRKALVDAESETVRDKFSIRDTRLKPACDGACFETRARRAPQHEVEPVA